MKILQSQTAQSIVRNDFIISVSSYSNKIRPILVRSLSCLSLPLPLPLSSSLPRSTTFKASAPVNVIILQPCVEYTDELSFQVRQYLPTVLTTSASIKQPTCQLNKGSHSANKEQIGRSSWRRAQKVPEGPKPPRCKHKTARSLSSITIRVLIASPRFHDPPYPASSPTRSCGL